MLKHRLHKIAWVLVLTCVIYGATGPRAYAAGPGRTRAQVLRMLDARRASACARRRVQDRFCRALASTRLAIPKLGSYAQQAPNYANSPILRKFIESLPGLGAANQNNLGQYLPLAVPDTSTYPGSDYYELGLAEHNERMHSDLPATGTKVRGYYQVNDGTQGTTDHTKHYLGPLIIANRNVPVRIKFDNLLPPNSKLFLPVDVTVTGAGTGPDNTGYSENRATLHLHGGFTQWISDGTPHQWITPSGETTSFPRGMTQQNVPDMPDPGPGSATFFYPNQQGARLMFYHDHSYGITRLNIYAGEAAAYLLTSSVEQDYISGTDVSGANPRGLKVLPDLGIPLIIQDRTFVSTTTTTTDPTWDIANWGGPGSLWFPHVYQPNQNPDGTLSPTGRWDYGPFVWPPATVQIPVLPTPSIVPEAFMDTPVINGTAYPYLKVSRRAYRFRILNASNDRMLNLQLYFARANGKGPMSGEANLKRPGPAIYQIGNEGGFLPNLVTLNSPPQPVCYDLDPKSATFGNVKCHELLLGPSERADIIVDFSKVAPGSRLILYNDAPAPMPLFDSRYDYFTGDDDQTAQGGAPSTRAGYGPNTRTLMQFRVTAGRRAAPYDATTLQGALPDMFRADQPANLVASGVYANNALCTTGDTNCLTGSVSHFCSTGPFDDPLCNSGTLYNVSLKTIVEDFDPIYGRMNALLGTETTSLNSQGQNAFGYNYVQPATEIMPADPADPDHTEIWMVVHNGIDSHSIHWHLFNVQVVNRVDWGGLVKPPDPNELGWKETVRMNPLENVIVAVRPSVPNLPFQLTEAQAAGSIRPLDVTLPPSDPTLPTAQGTCGSVYDAAINPNPICNFGWEYVWHCHQLGHEDYDMMRPYIMTVP